MQKILAAALKANVRLSVQGNELHIQAPKGALNASLRNGLKQHKLMIIDYLRSAASISHSNTVLLTPDPKNKHEPFPLTDIQYAYWLGRSSGVDYGNVATHFYFELDAHDMNIASLNDSLQKVIERHEMLRAIINSDGTQSILADMPYYEIPYNDCSHASIEEGEKAVKATRDILSHQVLSADKWPLFDIRATALPERKTRLHISLDLLILDAWSMFLIFKEWSERYENPQLQLTPLNMTYRDYVLAEQTLSSSDAWQRANDYWMSRIDHLPASPNLPVRLNNESAKRPVFSRRRAKMPAAKWQQLQTHARAVGLTPSGVLLAAYAEVLTLWSLSPHFTLNLTTFNRLPLHPEINDVVGDFTSLLLLEVDHRKGSSTFIDRAQSLQKQLAKDLEYREMSGVEVLRQWSRQQANPLQAMMPIVFTSALVLGESGDDAGLIERFGSIVYSISQTPQVWLDHQVMEVNGDLVFNWDAVDAVFEEGVLDAMFNAFQTLIEHLSIDDAIWQQQSVAQLPSKMHRLRQDTNATQTQYIPRLLHEGFVKIAQRQPEAIAIQTAQLDISYGKLLSHSLQIAHSLLDNGMQKEEPVAVLMEKGWEQIVAVLGILIAGGAYLPIDAHLPSRRQTELLRLGSAKQAIVQPSINLEIDTRQDLQIMRVLPFSGTSNTSLDDVLLEQLYEKTSLDGLAYIIFTSGTTGTPKGVMIDHRAANNTIEHINKLFSISSGDKVLCVSSLSFDLSVYDIFGLLDVGGCLVIPDAKKRHDVVHWHELMASKAVSIWNSAPQLMSMLIDNAEQFSTLNQSPLKTVLLSGDWISVDLPKRIQSIYADALVISLGGATEGSIWSIYHPVEESDHDKVSIPYGKPLPNQSMWVYDFALRPCPDYVKGQIFIGGDGVAKGYWRDDAKTLERFFPHPETKERLYYTGDIGCYATDGNIIFLGREDNQLKIRGHRVELGEISSVLRQHADIYEAIVLPTKEQSNGKNSRELVCYLQAEETISLLGYEESANNVLTLPQVMEVAVRYFDKQPLQDDLKNIWLLLDQFYIENIINFLLQRGVIGVVGESLIIDRLLAGGVSANYEHWLRRAFATLVEQGYATTLSKSTLRLIKPLPTPTLSATLQELRHSLIELLGFSQEEANQFLSITKNLQDILTQLTSFSEIYSNEEIANRNQKLFPNSHTDLLAVLQTICEKHQENKETIFDDTLIVLEVGTGFGTITQHILPYLQQHDAHYIFTDASVSILEHAQEIFGADSGQLSYQLYDVNIRPEFQGLAHHSVDVIIASDLLHNAQDIVLALSYLVSLLKPNGKLLLLEKTTFWRSFDLHLGLQQDFDRFTDTPLRKKHSLLSIEKWHKALKLSGFSEVDVVSNPLSISNYLGVNVFIASAPETIQHIDIDHVKEYLSNQLPSYMIPKHIITMHHMPVTENGKINYAALPDIPEDLAFSSGEIIAPRNEIESVLLKAWLKVTTIEQISISDNFFELGGDSLVATNLVREINHELVAFNLEIHEFFEHQSIESLAVLYDLRNKNIASSGDDYIKSLFPALTLDTQVLLSDLQRISGYFNKNKFNYNPNKAPQAIFITGATGWIGAYLLHDLLQQTKAILYCLVRADNEPAGLKILLNNQEKYGFQLSESKASRIKAVVGDLAKNQMGLHPQQWQQLGEELDAIYHLAASVNTLGSYEELFEVNVKPIIDLVDLATQHHAKSIFFASSIGLSIRYHSGQYTVLAEEACSEMPEGLLTGYNQSKWVAEKALMAAAEKGVAVTIYRITHALPSSDNKNSALILEQDYIFNSLLNISKAVGAIPDWPEGKMYGVPINIASQFITNHSLSNLQGTGVIHIENHQPMLLSDVIRTMLQYSGYADSVLMPVDEWRQACIQAMSKSSGADASMIERLFMPLGENALVNTMFGDEWVNISYATDFIKIANKENIASLAYWKHVFSD